MKNILVFILLAVLVIVTAVASNTTPKALPPVDCDSLVVTWLQVDTLVIMDTIKVVVHDTVTTTIYDTAIVPCNLWNIEYMITGYDPYAWPPDTSAWKAEMWLYDPVTMTGAGWVAQMRCVGQSGENRIFEIDTTSFPPQNIWHGGIGAKELFRRLDSLSTP